MRNHERLNRGGVANRLKTNDDKAMDCVYAVDELKASMKELQQQKLDNIVDDYEALASISEAVSSRSEAIVDYYTASGRVVNSKEAKQHMGTQRDEASKLVQVYLDEANAYADELKKAKTVFGEASVEYREAEAQYQEIYKSLIEAQTQVKDLDRAIFELDLTKLEYATERLRQFSEKLTAMFSLKQTRGTLFGQPGSVITESDYTSQASANNDVIKMLYADREKRIQDIAQFEDEVDSEKYKELADAIAKDEQEIYKLLESNEELKASIRELRWKPFHDLQEELNQTVEDFDHLRSLIKDRQMFDEDDGTQITARGYANLAMIAQQMVVARRQMADYREALNKLNEDYKNNNISLETYNEESREYVKIIQNAATATQGYKSAIVDMYKTQVTNENESLQDLIKLRSEALDKKREYYEYDKRLRGQNRDVQQIQAQINALQGVIKRCA